MSPEIAPHVAATAMTPGFIAGAAGRPLFTWHHAPNPAVRRGAGVVLCPPLGYEYMSAYRTWKLLSEALAELGFDVLRFDYDGTGNSAGDYTDPDRVEAWLRSIGDAISAARALSGSSAIALVGLRAGALLALHAAARTPVDRLVLWSPYASGSTYTRELKAFAALSRQDHADVDDQTDELIAAGHAFSNGALGALAKLTLDGVVTRPAHDVLIVHRDDRAADPAVALRLRQLGCCVADVHPDGTEAMLEQPQLAKVPDAVIREITGWFGSWTISSALRRCDSGSLHSGHLPPADARLEQIVRFGDDDRLFGLLGLPEAGTPHRAAVVLFNTGVEHHIGPHRMYVPLARQWVAAGHVVLRFDLGGIGDNVPPPGRSANGAYPTHMLDDAGDAIAFLRRRAPDRPVIAIGLCSGAWLAFRAAAENLDVEAIAAINPPLYLRERDRGSEWLAAQLEIRRYQQSMRAPQKWAKALRGRASYAAFFHIAGRALTRRLANRLGGAFGCAPGDGLSHDLVSIARRRVSSLFVFSSGGEGLAYFEAHARPAFGYRLVRSTVQHVVVEGAGHSFRPRAAQQRLRDLLTTFIDEIGRGGAGRQ